MVPRSGQRDFVQFVGGTDCSSFLGRIGGGQPINTACQVPSSIIHEIGHAVGLTHEHQRPDRAQHLRFHAANAQAGVARNFAPEQRAIPLTPFDFDSVMLYSSFAGANGRGPVFTTLDGQIYQRGDGLSQFDILGVAKIYGGSAAQSTPVEPPTPPSPNGECTPTRCDGIEDSSRAPGNVAAESIVKEYMICGNGYLAPLAYRCDGDNDCGNNYDELFCGNSLISPLTIEIIDCQNGRYIEESYRCDGYNDCINSVDEQSC